jgi:hypothetical protein
MQERSKAIVRRVEKGIGNTLDRAIGGSEIGDISGRHMSSSNQHCEKMF